MNFFQQPIEWGTLRVPNRVFLAPLAGVSDVPFRRICQELGAGLTYVEMLSAVAVHRRNKRTMDMCVRHEAEPLLGVQVTGRSAPEVADAVAFLSKLPFDTIDLNMGCSVRKVIASGSGSAVLSEPDRLSATVESAKTATTLPLSVKTRLGISRDALTIEDTARRVAEAGADGFTVHGRTQEERYDAPADRAGIPRGVAAARAAARQPIVTVGNGDLFHWRAARDMREQTDCDAVMISRGALGNPWIFREVLEQRTVHPTLAEWGDVVLRHLDYQEEHYGDTQLAAILSRKHLLWYIKGFPCNKALAPRLGHVERIAEARACIREYLAQWPDDIVRFEGAHRTDARLGEHSKYDPKYEMSREHDRGVGAEL